MLKSQIQTNVFSKLASLEQPLFNDWLRGWEVGCAFQAAAALKSTVRAQNTIKLNCAMNDSFLFIYFHRRLFFCLRRSGFVVGAQENGLGARPNFLYAGKTLESVTSCWTITDTPDRCKVGPETNSRSFRGIRTSVHDNDKAND